MGFRVSAIYHSQLNIIRHKYIGRCDPLSREKIINGGYPQINKTLELIDKDATTIIITCIGHLGLL